MRQRVVPLRRWPQLPHTTRPGKMAKLLMQMFRSLRCCIAAGFARRIAVEMRLRHARARRTRPAHGSRYGHEEAAAASLFDLLSVSESDLRSSRDMATSTAHEAEMPCGHLERAGVALEGGSAWTAECPAAARRHARTARRILRTGGDPRPRRQAAQLEGQRGKRATVSAVAATWR